MDFNDIYDLMEQHPDVSFSLRFENYKVIFCVEQVDERTGGRKVAQSSIGIPRLQDTKGDVILPLYMDLVARLKEKR
jgi:hypothetical protein